MGVESGYKRGKGVEAQAQGGVGLGQRQVGYRLEGGSALVSKPTLAPFPSSLPAFRPPRPILYGSFPSLLPQAIPPTPLPSPTPRHAVKQRAVRIRCALPRLCSLRACGRGAAPPRRDACRAAGATGVGRGEEAAAAGGGGGAAGGGQAHEGAGRKVTAGGEGAGGKRMGEGQNT